MVPTRTIYTSLSFLKPHQRICFIDFREEGRERKGGRKRKRGRQGGREGGRERERERERETLIGCLTYNP